jgi:hypothetical protein
MKVFKPSNGKDWETWGKEFGKRMEREGEELGEKIENAFKPNDEKKDVEEAEVVDEDTKKKVNNHSLLYYLLLFIMKREQIISSILWGLGLIIVGVLWLLSNILPDFNFNFAQWWPLLIVFVGLDVLLKGLFKSKD